MESESQQKPLCVDLDGTLIKSDILMESLLVLIKQNPLYLLLLPLWLLKGKANFKHQIAQRADINVARLPYQPEFINFLKLQKESGRRLVLATASNIKYADQIAFYLGLFDEVLASDATHNLSGTNKRHAFIEKFGEQGFVYAGNDTPDLKIWPHAAAAVLVNPLRGVEGKARKQTAIEAEFIDHNSKLKHYIKSIRPHQWLKNVLIFVALVTSHQFTETTAIIQALLAFVAFSLCASSVYLINDLLDLADDRKHPRKRHRPFAAGALSLVHGALLVPVLLLFSFALACMVSSNFVAVLSIYFALTLAYSFKLKRVMMLDVISLAALYTLRIIAGAVAIEVPLSFWLLAFSMFIFLSLAFVKRSTELMEALDNNKEKLSGRGYQTIDLEHLNTMGSASGYLSVLIIALYINSEEMMQLYTHPKALWLICPVLLYWVSRIWLKTGRGEMHDDPVIFALTDKASLLCGLIAGFLILVAI